MSDVVLVPEPSRDRLNQRQLVDYESFRDDFVTWLQTQGNDRPSATGYSDSVVEMTAYRTDQWFRWVWDRRGYTTDVGVDDADDYVQYLAESDYSNAHKRKCVTVLKRYFKWRDTGWNPELSFTATQTASNPRDFLTKAERTAIREAALEYGSVPSYGSLTPEKRSRWKAHLAQRFEKPKADVTPDDFERANGWKIPSLVWATVDVGLRPVEVERATVKWVDHQNSVLRIPESDSSKNRDNWVVALRDQTARMLKRWLQQRRTYPKYDDTDALWLTREGNPYDTHALNYVLGRLCDIAEIDTEHRSVTWYSIRHSVGTYMTREEDLAAAQAQLRHKSQQTTMQYDQAPVEERQDALDRMG